MQFNSIPGTKAEKFLEAQAPDGTDISIPVGIVSGATAGPVLAAVAGVHGTEYCGIEAVIRLHNEIEPQGLSGTLITVIANMPSFRGRSMYVCPIDGKNLGRLFPGTLEDGSYSDALAYYIFEELVRPADYVVDLHGGDLIEDLVVYTSFHLVEDEEINRQAEAMALAFGAPFLQLKRQPPDQPFTTGGLYDAAAEAGKVAVLAEAGGQGLLKEQFVAAHVEGIKNMMRQCGLLAEDPKPMPAPIYLKRFVGVTSPADGIFYPAVAASDKVHRGQFLGELRNYFGAKLQDVTSPVDGYILGVITSPPMDKGAMLFGIGEL